MTLATAHGRLSMRLRGRLITPADPDYDAARRSWNGIVDRRPALIAMCEGTADVIACLDAARDNDMPVAIRGGGHGIVDGSTGDHTLVIDLSRMRSVQVDQGARLGRAGSGATWGVVDHETQAFGLAVTGGVDSRIGIGRMTAEGANGYLARRQGLSIDHLVAAEVVLSDGQTVIANEHRHAELFWALRGGGSDFGVITNLEFRLHELGPEVMHARVFHGLDTAREALAFYRDYLADAPDDVGCHVFLMQTPPDEPSLAELRGSPALVFVACHAGSLETGAEGLQPIADHASPLHGVVAPIPYTALQSTFDPTAPSGARYATDSTYLDEMSDETIETLIDGARHFPGGYSRVLIEPMGGAIGRVDQTATAFSHRSASFRIEVSAGWTDEAHDEEAIAWTRHLVQHLGAEAAMAPSSPHEHAGARRLESIRERYDPERTFASTP